MRLMGVLQYGRNSPTITPSVYIRDPRRGLQKLSCGAGSLLRDCTALRKGRLLVMFWRYFYRNYSRQASVDSYPFPLSPGRAQHESQEPFGNQVREPFLHHQGEFLAKKGGVLNGVLVNS